jgi:hypothetical protein
LCGRARPERKDKNALNASIHQVGHQPNQALGAAIVMARGLQVPDKNLLDRR